METKEEIIQMLKGLFNVCRASELSFRAAADAIEFDTTKELFKKYSQQRADFAEELRSEIRFHSGTEYQANPLPDSWSEIRHAIERGDQQEVVQACERAEEAMMRVYETALNKRIPWDVQTVLAHQYSDIKEAHYFISALELFSNQFVV